MNTEKQWSEMTWQEKREERFKKWLSADDIKFNNPEAMQKYRERVTRMIKAFKMEIPDRVPVHLTSGAIIAYNAGYTLKDVIYDYSKIMPAWIKWLEDYDQDTNDIPGFFPARVYEILDYKMMRWPSHGLPDNARLQNFVEKEYMLADEYDLFINNPFDFGARYFTPRTWGAFEPLANMPPLSYYQGLPQRLMAMCQGAAFQKLFKAIWEASQENVKFQKVIRECAQVSLESGFPPLTGGMAQAPYDTVADSLRGTVGTSVDMYRQPEKLLEIMEAIVNRSVESAVNMTNMSRSPVVFIPMHKGDVSFMSIEQFKKFYWPTFHKLLLGLVNEGCVPWMVIDGRYDEARLEIISDLPRSSVVWNMEETDMFKAKEILGYSACITGNVTAKQLYTYSPQDIKDYCRKLIEVCGKGGGYILSLGSGPDKCDPACLRAIIESAQEYGVYG
ncbi:MAG: uroporphyrinogen decarboxylase family protein [Dehalococcoidia bacterium]